MLHRSSRKIAGVGGGGGLNFGNVATTTELLRHFSNYCISSSSSSNENNKKNRNNVMYCNSSDISDYEKASSLAKNRSSGLKHLRNANNMLQFCSLRCFSSVTVKGHLKRDKEPKGLEINDNSSIISGSGDNNINEIISSNRNISGDSNSSGDSNKNSNNSNSNSKSSDSDLSQSKPRITDVEREEFEKNAVKITKVGAVVNLSLAMSKGGLGYVIGSTALIADAANSAGDLLSDAVVYYTIKESRKSATPERPWGRGKLEPLGALLIAGLLLGTGSGVGIAAFQAAMEMISTLGISPELLNSENPIIIKLIKLLPVVTEATDVSKEIKGGSGLFQTAALGISAVSVVVKQILYKLTLSAGEKANSAAVMANAAQHKADVAISGAVFVGLTGSVLGYPLLDPLAGLLVSGLVVKQAIVTGLDSLIDLSDTPADKEETEELRRSILKVSGIVSVEKLLARKSGPYLYVECTIGVNGTISASAAHRLAMLAKQSLLHRHKGRVANAVVHVYPLGSGGLGERDIGQENDRDHEHIAKEVTKAVLSLSDITSVSEVQVYYKDDGKIVVKIDVCMKPDLSIKAAHALAVKARLMIEKVFPSISTVDVDLELEETEVHTPAAPTAQKQ